MTRGCVRQAGRGEGLTLYDCAWEHLLLLGAGDLRRVRRFVLEHLAMGAPSFSLESDLYLALIGEVRIIISVKV